jgi:hypothetical protein
MRDTNEHKRKHVVTIDLTNDAEVVLIQPDGKRVVISEDEEETEDADSEEEEGNCCGICGSEYETREDTADVCEECYESERNICHGCKEVFANAEFLDEEGEYCEGFCKECYRSVLDKLDPLVQLLKK